MVLLRSVLLVLPLVLVSCWTPWFDPDVSLATLTKAKLSSDGEFSLYSSYDRSMTSFQAVPARTRAPRYVTVLARSWTGFSTDTYSYGGGSWSNVGYRQGRSFDTAVTDPALVQGFGGSSLTSSWNVAVFEPTLGNGSLEVLSTTPMMPYPGAASSLVLGAFAAPNPTMPSQDALYYLELTAGSSPTLSLSRAASIENNSPWSLPQASVWSGSYQASTEYGWIAVNPADPTKLLYWTHHSKDADGHYQTDVWDASQSKMVAQWSRSDHVEAVLTSGKLLTRDGSYYSVCDAAGVVEFSFPAGTLQFCGEFWDSTELRFRVRFTEAVPLGSNGDNLFRVGLYSIPTTELGSLR